MRETDPDELADKLEDEANHLERHNEELGRRTQDVSQEWERKRSDESVPGAPPPEGDDDGPATGKDADG